MADDELEITEDDILDEDETPTLESEGDRDWWIELLMQQTDGEDDVKFIPSIFAIDPARKRMVVRFSFPDGSEEVYDLIIDRQMSFVLGEDAERN